jgi:triacylglycerol lipase
MICLLAALSLATESFDPTVAEAVFNGRETWTQDETIKLWGAVERWRDPDCYLFGTETFNKVTSWPLTADHAPWIAASFATDTPDSASFLLHVGISDPNTTGTPVLMVPGAMDNGSRSFVTLATRMDRLERPVYAMTFAHPHGDIFMQAEAVANAIAVIKTRTGADQVDLVGHSKGAIVAATYASHHEGADWSNKAYETVGTTYRGDVRRLLLVAAPLAGVDTSYRWPALNLLSLNADFAPSPTSWSTWYPSSTAWWSIFESLADQDFAPDGLDLFPGQRQLLARQDYPLPGSQAWLTAFAMQPDWWTTYEGGLGYWSDSDGIDAAIVDGDHFLARLAVHGVDPEIPIWILAGSNPILPTGDLVPDIFEGAPAMTWGAMIDEISDHGVSISAADDELRGLGDGHLILGEVTGPSDGLVFINSATDESVLTARGARVVETRVADLSHLDLLYASPITGELMIEAGEANPAEDGWMRTFGKRYIVEDTLGWIEEVLGDDPAADSPDDTVGEEHFAPGMGELAGSCNGCNSTPSGSWLVLVFAALGLPTRRLSATGR